MRKWRASKPIRAYYRMVVDHAKTRKIKVLCTYEEFAAWAIEKGLFSKDGVRDKDKTIDRKDGAGPYAIWNLDVLTLAENVAKGNKERHYPAYRENRWVGDEGCKTMAMLDDNGDPF
jgi:hypothetical protein